MFINRKTIEQGFTTGTGFFSIKQVLDGWLGSGFKQQFTEIQTRFVNQTDKQEAQIQLVIIEVKESGKEFVQHGSFVLTPEQAKALALSIYPELRGAIEGLHVID